MHQLPLHPERLETLAVMLIADANNAKGVKFDLTQWVAPSKRSPFAQNGYGYVTEPKLPAIDCGTSACAMGLAVLSGKFEPFGLKVHWFERGGIVGVPTYYVPHPECNGRQGFGAAAELFGISAEDARYLFDPDSYDDDNQKGAKAELAVAERIRYLNAGVVEKEHHPDYDVSDDCGEDEDDED